MTPPPNWLRPKVEPGYRDSADALRARAQRAEAEGDRLRGLLTLWVNFADVELRALVPGPNGKSLAELTREAFDRDAAHENGD